MRALRRRAWGAALLVWTGCAHVEAPTGGPDDRTGPQLVTSRPDTLAVVPGLTSPVVLQFDERISEQRLEEAVMVSPRTSPVVVDHSGSAVRVSLRRGWEEGRIYQVQVRPIIQDLFNNRLAAPVQLVFSTGPAIPDTRLAGTVVDRITGKPDVDARVEAVRVADSLVYAVPTDSAGRFVVARVPEGEYRIRAFRDANRNRAIDPYEQRDTTSRAITGVDTVAVQLSTVLPDSTAPRAAGAEVARGAAVEIRFDDHLDPAQPLAPAAVTIVGPDSVAVGVARVVVGTPPSAADSARAASAAGRTPDALPSQTLTAVLAEGARLAPDQTYLVRVRGVRNVVGLAGDSETRFEAPPPPPAPADPPGAPPPAPGGAGAFVPPDAQPRP